MPRLNDRKYLQAHKKLRRVWLHNNIYYSNLDAHEQWQLHDYFQPAKDWTDDQLLEHRVKITKERPSLPHEAGRALAKFDQYAAQEALARVRLAKLPRPVETKRRNVRSKNRNIIIRSTVNPEPNFERVVEAMTWYLIKEGRVPKEDDKDDAA